MLDSLFDLFDRDKKAHGSPDRKRSLVDRLSSVLDGDDDRSYRSSDRRHSDEDEDYRDRGRHSRRDGRDRLFDFD
ncbi:MAG: hypothetical protein M3Y37_03165 [Chloroflexota bacterium]|jgi:hypothetical protein|nr:hypothetical protein [Chloroflexota bacterium]